MNVIKKDTYQPQLLRVFKALSVERSNLWKTFLQQIKEKQWDLNSVGTANRNALFILNDKYTAAGEVNRKKILSMVDDLLDAGLNPLDARSTQLLWWSNSDFSQHLFQRIIKRGTYRTENGGNLLHTLLDHENIMSWRFDCRYRPDIPDAWVNEKQDDGKTPLQNLWFSDEVYSIYRKLNKKIFDSTIYLKQSSLYQIWVKTQFLLELGADLDLPYNGVSCRKRICDMAKKGITISKTPEWMRTATNTDTETYNCEQLFNLERKILADSETLLLEKQTKKPLSQRKRGPRL